jgi:hypothetical protein
MSARVVPIDSRRRRLCAGRGIAFRPIRSEHDFCSKCHRLGRAGHYLELAAKLYKFEADPLCTAVSELLHKRIDGILERG